MNWDEQYKSGQGRYFPAEELVRFLGRTYGPVTELGGSGLTAVEIGCGVGGNMRALAEWGFFVYGLEYSREAIRLAQAYALQKNFMHAVIFKEYCAPEAIKLPSGSVNLVLDIQTIQHLDKAAHLKTYQEICRILAPEGRFFSIHWAGSASNGAEIFPGHPELGTWEYGGDFPEIMALAGLSIKDCQSVVKSYSGIWMGQWSVVEAVKV